MSPVRLSRGHQRKEVPKVSLTLLIARSASHLQRNKAEDGLVVAVSRGGDAKRIKGREKEEKKRRDGEKKEGGEKSARKVRNKRRIRLKRGARAGLVNNESRVFARKTTATTEARQRTPSRRSLLRKGVVRLASFRYATLPDRRCIAN